MFDDYTPAGNCRRPDTVNRTGWLRLLFCGGLAMLLLAAGDAVQAAKFKSFKLQTLDGATVTLEDFRDKATLVAFFFPTCTYCNQALPSTVRIYEKYRDQGLSMVWINVVEDEEDQVADWRAQHRYEVPVLIGATQNALARRYRLEMTPEHYLLDADRNILFRQRGYETGYEAELEANVRKALSLPD